MHEHHRQRHGLHSRPPRRALRRDRRFSRAGLHEPLRHEGGRDRVRDEQLQQAVFHQGRGDVLIYDGIEDSLRMLRNSGCKLAIVTQKNEKFINNMLGVYKTIGELFDEVCATNVDVEMTKSEMLLKVCKELDVAPADSIFIGDSYVDALAAKEVGMDFAAALYGWGFRSREDAERYDPKICIGSAEELYKKISLLD
ncbi:MAG: HAD hydrolase-like protein [Ruminococcus sp.]|nr:HAD hydrolase-like protein [Ruminococcus sp.]